MRIALLVCYDGTDFCGWQSQTNLRSVQSVLCEAAEKALSERVTMTASGRTDAGVHALGQVVVFDSNTTIPPEKIRDCLNRVLPPDVKVLKSAAAPDFDITRAAKSKTYVYKAYFAETEVPLYNRYYARLLFQPNVSLMKQAAKLIKGEHDFAAFRASGYTSKTSVRTITNIDIKEESYGLFTTYELSVTGNGFLYNMVRILAGELFAIGCGKQQGITKAFETGDRRLLSKTMPPQGLFLKEVEYGVPLFGTKE